MTGKAGVVIATSGPGATNLVTGIANAYLDSVPMVAITGNVSCSLIGKDSFQEVDIMGITMPVTKHNYMVKDVAILADVIREAFEIARSGRPGPVLIDIPKDVQINKAEYEKQAPATAGEKPVVPEDAIDTAVKMIEQSSRPYIYCGGGIVNAEAGAEVVALADKIDAPVGCSMMGLSAIPSGYEKNLGMTGMHGKYAASRAKAEADLVIALGVRFSDRATGDKSRYASKAKIIHIDIDDAEINKNISAHLGVTGDVREVLSRILAKTQKSEKPEWDAQVAKMKTYGEEHTHKMAGRLTPEQIIEMTNAVCSADTPIATDVGQHQMWVAQYYQFSMPRTLVTSGGLGTMGYGMGAAIGACCGTGKRTVLFTGDGSFGMNLNEMATAVSQNLPLVIVVMNNGVLGMVRQWQTLFYGERYSQTTLGRKTDFKALAEAFGAKGMRAETAAEFAACIKQAFETDGPVLIDCIIDKDEKVLPMIPPNGSVEELILN